MKNAKIIRTHRQSIEKDLEMYKTGSEKWKEARKELRRLDEMETQLLTAKDAANICQLSKRTWFRLNSSGRIPAPVRIGGSIRWRKTDIQQWLELGCPNREELPIVEEVE